MEGHALPDQNRSWLRVSAEVEDCVRSGRPVVALESTVLAHGLPRPLNLEVGRRLEAIVRAAGAVPATIAVLEGVPTVGLARDELERVATDTSVLKLSTRDIPLAMGSHRTGATTVASTLFLAASAGIDVFATGGIGGVHRGTPLDVSADLLELHRTSMVVVCAGAKSILDLPATREALETLGVPVLGWRTEELPGFYTAQTGLAVDARVETAADVATIWSAQKALTLSASLLVCVPIPADQALPQDVIDGAIRDALHDASEGGVRGKAITPYLLRRIAEVTGGSSLEANIALLASNAEVAAEIATALSRQ